jgi:tRNA pseudouridine55 synthase
MGRRKGRDISGWVIVDKPAGPTSTAIVNKVRWAFDAKKAGHAGTLDPAATGLLAIALGEATKVIPYVTDALKAYEFTINLGASTNTDDAEGTVLETSELRPTDDAIIAALAQFTGQIDQVPPKFSAVKIDGERAYTLARDNEEFEIAARPLWVESLSFVERPDPDCVVLEMVCGKGGYVRSIARDLGAVLGCLGHVKSLRRTWSGPFDCDGALTFEQIEKDARSPAMDDHMRPLSDGLVDLPELVCSGEGALRLKNGNPGLVLTAAEYGDTAWASYQGTPIAIGTYRSGELHPSRVFNLP